MRMAQRPLPPLQLLPTFEAAARLLSFKLAARELHVTPSAVSQQLRALEQALGVALFERRPRAVSLTEAGAYYYDVARETLFVFQRGSERLHERFAQRRLRISTDASVAYEVLIPGLSEFQTLHPDVDLRVEASSALVEPGRDAIDAAVRFGRGPWPGLCADPLLSVVATLVAAPSLLRNQPLASIRDLGAHTLLEISGAPDHWSQLATTLGFRIKKRVAFDSYLATLQAASHGVGVAMGLFPISTNWVRDGRLTTPLELRVPGPIGYHLVYRPEDRERPELGLFRRWLTARFAALPPLDAPQAATARRARTRKR
jgi:LysR family glycine cleavage system transcriptional activator